MPRGTKDRPRWHRDRPMCRGIGGRPWRRRDRPMCGRPTLPLRGPRDRPISRRLGGRPCRLETRSLPKGARGRPRWHRQLPIPKGTRDIPRRPRKYSTHDPSQPILGAWRTQPWIRRTACRPAAPVRVRLRRQVGRAGLGLLVVRIRLVGVLLGRPAGLVGVWVVRVRSALWSLDPVGHRPPSSRRALPGGSRPTPGLVGPAGPSLSI